VHVAQRHAIASVVAVAHETGDGCLEFGRHLIRDLVDVPLDTLVIALQLAVGLRMERCCQDVSDAYQPEPLSLSSLVLSATGTSVMPVSSTASWTTSIKESEVMSR